MAEFLEDRKRTFILALVVALAGGIVFLIAMGLRASWGFLMGAVLSMLNMQGMALMVNILLGFKSPGGLTAVLISLRYLLLGAAVYGIVRVLGFAPVPVLCGLFATFAAVLLEALYELISQPAKH